MLFLSFSYIFKSDSLIDVPRLTGILSTYLYSPNEKCIIIDLLGPLTTPPIYGPNPNVFLSLKVFEETAFLTVQVAVKLIFILIVAVLAGGGTSKNIFHSQSVN